MLVATKLILAGAVTFAFLQNADSKSGTGAGAGSPASANRESTDTLGPQQPVITVHGACAESEKNPPKGAGGCTTVIAREQFENLIHALHPGQELPAAARNNLAKLYAEYLIVETAARKAGMEDTAEFREFMSWMRVLAASEYYRRKLQERYGNLSPEEVHAFYQEHQADFETVHLLRVVVPRENRLVANQDEFGKKAQEAIRAARVDLLKGMDPAEVQRNTYKILGLESSPLVDLGKRTRKDFMAEEAAAVFSLKPGEITQVLTEASNYVIYKVVNREMIPESDLAKSISTQLTERKFKETMKSVLDAASVDLNEKYFGAPTSAPGTPPVSPHSTGSH